jgi:hypothetical protein
MTQQASTQFYAATELTAIKSTGFDKTPVSLGRVEFDDAVRRLSQVPTAGVDAAEAKFHKVPKRLHDKKGRSGRRTNKISATAKGST